ncbi:hypothetical protein CRUP_000324 [Coryphaenoides rupestris]|nr:hypothetical protein CRUP_000324 [Coryphaenoides rupestris]
MADEEETDGNGNGGGGTKGAIGTLQQRLRELHDAVVRDSGAAGTGDSDPDRDSDQDPSVRASSRYCQDFCRTLLEYAGCWKVEQDPHPLVEVYTAALLAYSRAAATLSPRCDNVPLRAHVQLQESGLPQLGLLCSLTQQPGVWASTVLQALLTQETQPKEQVEEFLDREGPVLLEMRLKQLMKEDGRMPAAAAIARACAHHPAFQDRGHFKQTHLLSEVDCRDALEMICNLEAEGDERAAFSLCSAFLTHQLLQGDTYCAWELTLFWSKLLKRLESSEQGFLDSCRKMSALSKTLVHILFLIKVVQSEVDSAGLPTCIEMCIRALQLESSDGNSKATICKTLSCLLPDDLEVKRACQLTEFLLEPTVDAYYAVESLYNEPDQKLEEENMPVPNSLRCELLLVFKTQWPFDPEFWDWRALKRQCLALMGEEASIVSSIDLLNDNEDLEDEGYEVGQPGHGDLGDVTDRLSNATNETDRLWKNREMKRLRAQGFVSARFRNFQAYMQYCVLCDKEFLGHRIAHGDNQEAKRFLEMQRNKVVCQYCRRQFVNVTHLNDHLQVHCGVNPYICIQLNCKASFQSNPELLVHRKSHSVFKARCIFTSCGKIFNDAYKLYDHEAQHYKTFTSAFTIQQNLILHYRAIHQSALSVLEVKKEQDGTEAADESRESEVEEEDEEEVADSDNEVIPEFRCLEKDCCRVFQEVPSLLQHYLQLHEFSLDKAGAILSRINLGRFACDQQGCVAMFTTFWKYVGHIKDMHGGVKLSRHETINGFSCDVEDCDRTYATKYNLLRHTMKKHPETYQLKVMNQPIPEECAKQTSKNSHNSHYPIVKANNGKENIESNKKLQKGCEKKRLEKTQKNNWTKYGKPSLKSKGEASAMCTKTFTLQYPCMLKGCDYVMRSERSIMKHYMGHGLSERYLEEQRSHFIFCKKFSRYKHRSDRSDDSKSENSSDLSDSDIMTDTGLGGSGGRPRKVVGNIAKPKPARRPARKTRIVYPSDEETDSCDSSAYLALTPDYESQLSSLTSFKPMGFEEAFLKFLEHSKPPQSTPARSRGRPPGKKNSSHTKDTCVEFSNRQNLESMGQVKILVDGAYSTVSAHLLKQLQDMRPTVILEKND